jgi:hypothetical protein
VYLSLTYFDCSVSEETSTIYEGKSVVLIGWGSSNKLGAASNILKRVDITVLPQRFVV